MNLRLTFGSVAALFCTIAASHATIPRVHEYARLERGDGFLSGFGDSVALGGNTALVGGPLGRIGNRFLRQVLRFDRATGVESNDFGIWIDVNSRLDFDELQSDLAVQGEYAVVGFASDSAFPSFGEGSAHLIDLATGEEIRQFVPSDGRRTAEFGYAVAIDNGVVLVGDSNGDPFQQDANAAYLFDAMTGEELLKLTIDDDGFPNNFFGASVALAKNYAFVGAPGDRSTDFRDGSVRVFDINTGSELLAFEPSDRFGDSFGISLAVDNGIALVGASRGGGEVRGSGAAYLFNVATGDVQRRYRRRAREAYP